jgi:hypothetical protein
MNRKNVFSSLKNLQTHERCNMETKSDDRHFAVALLSEKYRLHRVQISEEPFLPMAQLAMDFSVGNSPVSDSGHMALWSGLAALWTDGRCGDDTYSRRDGAGA